MDLTFHIKQVNLSSLGERISSLVLFNHHAHSHTKVCSSDLLPQGISLVLEWNPMVHLSTNGAFYHIYNTILLSHEGVRDSTLDGLQHLGCDIQVYNIEYQCSEPVYNCIDFFYLLRCVFILGFITNRAGVRGGLADMINGIFRQRDIM